MISFIRGTVADLTENSAIIESNCIGFEINMTGNALAQLHIGQEVKLHTYFQVREDAMVLYGFFNKDEFTGDLNFFLCKRSWTESCSGSSGRNHCR